MGSVETIGPTTFPKQGEWLYLRTDVIFHYDSRVILTGTIVRDDMEAPWVTIIKLDDGRHVLATECQHSPHTPHKSSVTADAVGQRTKSSHSTTRDKSSSSS